VYRPPDFGVNFFLDELEMQFSEIVGECDIMFCMGDLNINLFHCDREPGSSLVALLDGLGLTQLIDSPTRITATSSTLIDLIITNKPDIAMDSGTLDVQIADHDIIFSILYIRKEKQSPIYKTYRDFRHLNEETLYNDLMSLPLHFMFHMETVSEKVEFLNNSLHGLLDIHAPVKTSRITKPFSPWLTDNVRLLLNFKRSALNKFKRTQLEKDFKRYKSLRNLATTVTRIEKKAYLNHKLSTHNTKELWRGLRNMNIISHKSTKIPDELNDVNLINQHFVSSVPPPNSHDELMQYYRNNKLLDNSELFNFKFVSTAEVGKIVCDISSNATGSDGLNITIIKLCTPYIINFITHIVNVCIETNDFPRQWKTSIVRPLPKISEPSTFNDLRPISIQCVLAKVLEKCMEIQIRSYIDENDIFPQTQSGFRSGHGCDTALLHITDDIIAAQDRGLLTAVILLDYSKAFDTISHTILASVLSFIGFAENAINLIFQYLTDRVQVVSVDNRMSLPLRVVSGVPQGSILGPLLFSIYTSQLPGCLKTCNIHMYADDTQLYYSFHRDGIKEASQCINDDLNALSTLSHKHSLVLNPSKSAVVLFGKYDLALINNFNIAINNQTLPLKTVCKNLGLHIDSGLKFKEHVSQCIKKAYSNLKLIFHNRKYLNVQLKQNLCNCLVLSQFNHCDVVYGPCLSAFDSERIQRLQRSCLRLIHGVRKFEPISHKLRSTGWLNMYNRRLLHSLTLFHKIITNRAPPYLYNKIRFRTDVHNLNLRHRNTITIPSHRTTFFKRSFCYNVAKCYNMCTPVQKQLSVKAFKKQMRTFLFKRQCE